MINLKCCFACVHMLSKSRHKAKRKTSDLENNQSKQRYILITNVDVVKKSQK